LIVVQKSARLPGTGRGTAPVIVAAAGRKATRRFYEFFTATIRNKNTREAYYRALSDFFAWCDDHGFDLIGIERIVVAAYVEYLVTIYSKPTASPE
jgi:site-specific recombinase XerD